MNKEQVIKILTEMNKWRRGLSPYNEMHPVPYSSTVYGEALDSAIQFLSAGPGDSAKENQEQENYENNLTI